MLYDLVKETNLPIEIIEYIYSFRPILRIELLLDDNDIHSCMINILENDFDNEVNYYVKNDIYNFKITDLYSKYFPLYKLKSFVTSAFISIDNMGNYIYKVKNESNYYDIIDEILQKIDFFINYKNDDYYLMNNLYELMLYYINYSYTINYYYYSLEYEE